MQEAFFKSSALSKSELHALMKQEDKAGILRFSILIISFLLMSFAMVHTWGGAWWTIVLVHIGFAATCCNAFACLHESAHGTAFQSKHLGDLVARIAGILHIYPASLFRSLHFTHHRYTHIPGLDPEISLGPNPAPALLGQLPIYLVWITGLPLLLFKVFMMFACLLGLPEFLRTSFFPFIRPQKRLKVALDSLLTISIYVGVLYLALYHHPGFWGIFTGQMVGHCVLATYLVMEHNGLPHDGHILEKTRSIHTNRLVKFIMWNMPYHAEHHAFPAVPFHALPKLHNLIESELTHKNEGVGDLHLKMLKGGFRAF